MICRFPIECDNMPHCISSVFNSLDLFCVFLLLCLSCVGVWSSRCLWFYVLVCYKTALDLSLPLFSRVLRCAALTLTQSVSVLQIFMTSTFIQLIQSFVHRGKTLKAREGYQGVFKDPRQLFSSVSGVFLCASTCGETLMLMRFWRDADAEAGL